MKIYNLFICFMVLSNLYSSWLNHTFNKSNIPFKSFIIGLDSSNVFMILTSREGDKNDT